MLVMSVVQFISTPHSLRSLARDNTEVLTAKWQGLVSCNGCNVTITSLRAIGNELYQCHALQVVASMRDDFELHGQGAFEPAQAHSQQDAVFFTDQMTVEPLPKDSLERQAWQSTWQDAGWLRHNPLVGQQA